MDFPEFLRKEVKVIIEWGPWIQISESFNVTGSKPDSLGDRGQLGLYPTQQRFSNGDQPMSCELRLCLGLPTPRD